MSTRQRLKWISGVILMGLVAGCVTEPVTEKPLRQASTVAEAMANRQDRPNIIYILADDLGYGDLSCYGQKKFQTPNIDRLAVEGMKFTQHYSGSTVCAPSRCSLMTGKHTGHAVVRGNKEIRPEGQAPMPAGTVTIPHASMSAPKELYGQYRKKYPQFEDITDDYGGDMVTNPVAAFPAMVEHLDNGVGEVMVLLKEPGIDDNTIVMFTSDNGPHVEGGHDPVFWDFNGPLRGFKRDLYEGASVRRCWRAGNWKAVRLNVTKNPDALIELYDLSTDLGEENNVADEHPLLVKKMDAIMQWAHIPAEAFPLFPSERCRSVSVRQLLFFRGGFRFLETCAESTRLVLHRMRLKVC